MSGIDEKQLVLYAQMGTLVNLILQWPEMNVKEIAVNFSKVLLLTFIFLLICYIVAYFC